jgi:hypothetical protein
MQALSEQRATVWFGASQCVLAAAALLAVDSVQPAIALLLRGGEAEVAYAVAQALRLPLDDTMQDLLIELARRAVRLIFIHALTMCQLDVRCSSWHRSIQAVLDICCVQRWSRSCTVAVQRHVEPSAATV